MIKNASIKLDRRFTKQAKGAFEQFNFDVGVLQDAPHKNAVGKKKGLKSYAGGPARMTGSKSYQTMGEVSESLRKQSGINFYTKPFKSVKNRDILKFIKKFFELCTGKGQIRQVENTLQAIVRNPILRGDYGSNTNKTAKVKGFNRFMIDTAQLFKAITARVKRVKRV